MTTYAITLNADVTDNKFSGSGQNLTNIPRSGFETGTPNHVLVNDSNGYLSSASVLNQSLGGTGIDTTGLTGVTLLNNGTWSVANELTGVALNRSDMKAIANDANKFVCNDADGKFSASNAISYVDNALQFTTPTEAGYLDLAGALTFGQVSQSFAVSVDTTDATPAVLYQYQFVETSATVYILNFEVTAMNINGTTVHSALYSGSVKVINNKLETPNVVNVSPIIGYASAVDELLVDIGGVTFGTSPTIKLMVTGKAATALKWRGMIRLVGETDKLVTNSNINTNTGSSGAGGTGGTATANIDLIDTYKIINSAAPTNPNDLATKTYVDTQIAAIPSGNVNFVVDQASFQTTNANNTEIAQYSISNNTMADVKVSILSKNPSTYDSSLLEKRFIVKCDGSGVVTEKSVLQNQLVNDTAFANMTLVVSYATANKVILSANTGINATIDHNYQVNFNKI